MPRLHMINHQTRADGGETLIQADDDGNLYVNGKQVVMKSVVRLDPLLNSVAVAAGLATAVQAIVAVLAYLC